MNKERIGELKERALEGLKNAQEYHDIFPEGVVKDSWGKRVSFWTDLLALLEEAQIMAGGATGFGKTNVQGAAAKEPIKDSALPVSKNLTPAESPGLPDSDERERVRSLLEDVCGDCIHEGRPLVSDGVIDSILAPPKPTVTREWVENFVNDIWVSESDDGVRRVITKRLRDLGITVEEEK